MSPPASGSGASSTPTGRPHVGWDPAVTSTCVESGGEVVVIDALVPETGADAVWARLDDRRPTAAVVLKPDHVRSVDRIVQRYRARAFGPSLFWRDDIPETDLEAIEPGSELPGGLIALYDGRGRNETPLWLPEHRIIVFADALTERDGDLRVWGTPWHEERVLPALRAMLDLPFEHVIVAARRAGPRPGGVRAGTRTAAVGRVTPGRYSGS